MADLYEDKPTPSQGGEKIGGRKKPRRTLEEWHDVLKLSTRKRKRLLIKELRKRGNIEQSCQAAAINRDMYRQWRDADPDFAKRADNAIEAALDRIEYALYQRGVLGLRRKVGWYKGEAGGEERVFSDRAAELLLKAKRPKEYATQTHEVRGLFATLDLSRLSDEQIARLAKGESPLSVLGQDALAQLPAPEGRDLSDVQEGSA